MKVGRPKRRFDSSVLLDLCAKHYSIRGMAKLFNCAPLTIKKGILEIVPDMKEKGYTDEAIAKDILPVIGPYCS